jgi:hypothetical protein
MIQSHDLIVTHLERSETTGPLQNGQRQVLQATQADGLAVGVAPPERGVKVGTAMPHAFRAASIWVRSPPPANPDPRAPVGRWPDGKLVGRWPDGKFEGREPEARALKVGTGIPAAFRQAWTAGLL